MNKLENISIIIAVYNGASVIDRCLQSIRAQSVRPMELIIIDGGSSDGTPDLVRAYGDIVTTFVSEPDRGIYDAWNKGVARATGDWVMFLGADDVFYDSETLKELSAFASTISGPRDLVYGCLEYVDSNGSIVERRGAPWQELQPRMVYEMSLPHPGTLHRRTIFDRYGYFDATYRIAGDYDLIRRVVKDSIPQFFPRVIVKAGVGGVSTRPGMILLSIREVGRAIAHGDGKRHLRWYWLLAKGIAKYVLVRAFGAEGLERAKTMFKGA